jgi:glycosyltransferase involved in cell wall biosynthesis
MPKVTVIVPTYNCAQYITEAIESVLNQTYKDFEIIIVDDGSIDNTKEILSNYISEKIIRYYFQNNKGVSSARNKGIGEAKGDLIAFLDADDKWLPERLEKSIEFLEINNYDWVCSSFYRMERDTGKNDIKRVDHKILCENICDINMLKKDLFYFSSKNINMNTILVKKKCFEKIGLFDESLKACEDYDMLLRFEEAELRGGFLDIPLAYYIIRKDGITRSCKYKKLDSDLKVAVKHAYRLGIRDKKIRRSLGEVYYNYADVYFNENNDFLKTIYFTFKGLYYNPQMKKILSGIRILIYKKLYKNKKTSD